MITTQVFESFLQNPPGHLRMEIHAPGSYHLDNGTICHTIKVVLIYFSAVTRLHIFTSLSAFAMQLKLWSPKTEFGSYVLFC